MSDTPSKEALAALNEIYDTYHEEGISLRSPRLAAIIDGHFEPLRASNDRMFKINEGLLAENAELSKRVKELDEAYSYIVAENVKLCNENYELAEALRGMLDRYAPTHSALCFALRTNGTSAPCCCDKAEQVARETLARYDGQNK